MSSTEIATRTPQQELVASVRSDSFRAQVALALPEGMKPERFQRVVVTALLDNPELAEADHNSIFQAALKCATDGLLPDGREAAFVKFNDKKKGPVCVYLSMIAGLRKIAAEFGWSIQTRIVYENDTFDHELGIEETIKHTPTRPGLERGPMVAAYAVGRHRDHPPEIEVLTVAEIEKVRETSRAKDYGPWKDWYERMAEKTAGRRLFAKLPLGERDRARIASVLDADDLAPGDAAQLLYGREISAPVTQVPSPAGEEDGTEQAAGEVVEEAKQESTSSSETDGPPSPASAEPEPGPEIEEGQFTVPESVDADADVQAANEAAEALCPFGKHKGTSLKDLVALGDEGAGRIRWALKSWKWEPFRSQVWAFAKVYAPDLYEAAKAEGVAS